MGYLIYPLAALVWIGSCFYCYVKGYDYGLGSGYREGWRDGLRHGFAFKEAAKSLSDVLEFYQGD